MNAMILKALSFATLIFTASSLCAEIITLHARVESGSTNDFSSSIELAEGDVARVLSAQFEIPSESRFIFCSDVDGGCSPIAFSESECNGSHPVFGHTGSLYVIAEGNTGTDAIVTLEVIRADEASEYLPINTIVIPSEPVGEVQVMMESSTDLVNWTSATPGTYSTSTEQRFFRIRMVRLE